MTRDEHRRRAEVLIRELSHMVITDMSRGIDRSIMTEADRERVMLAQVHATLALGMEDAQ